MKHTRSFLCTAGSTLLVLLLMLANAAAKHMQQAPGVTSSGYTLEAEADRVKFLPGGPAVLDFGLFSGYVTVDEPAGRALFYVFAEARTAEPSKAPLLLWLNGGPGCSSLGGGFMSELGPFYPTQGGDRLQPNPYSWNNLTNVLWLESPAFVGFSYSNTTSDQIVGDGRTAADGRMFLLHWMKRFPQYAQADLYLSGESYGGHYVPNLALEIVRGNKKAPTAAAAAAAPEESVPGVQSAVDTSSSSSSSAAGVSPGKGYLNLKGFFVGNAWTDAAIDNRGALDFWYSHAMISAESHTAISENCDFSNIGPLLRGAEALSLPGTHSNKAAAAAAATKTAGSSSSRGGASASGDVSSGLGHSGVSSWWSGYGSSSVTRFWEGLGLWSPSGFSHRDSKDMVCARWLDIAQAELGNINIYEIYADVCVQRPNSASSNSASSSSKSYRGALLGDVHPRRRVTGGTGEDGGEMPGHLPRKPRYDPCIDGEVETYFNLPAVQEALHANQTVKLPWRWTDCSQDISYSREDLLSSMLPVYHELLQAEPALKLWVFSGDVDGIVPVLGSRRWIESLQLPVKKPWRAWTSRTGQVGGWRVDYHGLTFATVRNSGHMVPYVTPERAFHLLGEFMATDKVHSSTQESSTTSTSSSSKGAATASF